MIYVNSILWERFLENARYPVNYFQVRRDNKSLQIFEFLIISNKQLLSTDLLFD